MKIRLAILEKDTNYLRRIVSVFSAKYADKVEVYSFTDVQMAVDMFNTIKIDMMVANIEFDIDIDMLPKKCAFAYLVDSSDIDTVNGQRAISKFQKVEFIYKQIIGIYAEKYSDVTELKKNGESTGMIVFFPISGGVGSSSMAAACARHLAMQGKKTLYLNLEQFSSSDEFFSSDGQNTMSDVILDIKSGKNNLGLKLESYVKQDASGVYFFSKPRTALDMLEFSLNEKKKLLSELCFFGTYDFIVIDMDFNLNELEIYSQANVIVCVGDGSLLSNSKMMGAYEAITTMEQESEGISLSNRMYVVYNKFSAKTGRMKEEIRWKNMGAIEEYSYSTIKELIQKMSNKNLFETIFR